MIKMVTWVALWLALTSTIIAQNVFDPPDTTAKYYSTQPYGSRNNPNPAKTGLHKWVSVTNGNMKAEFDSSYIKLA